MSALAFLVPTSIVLGLVGLACFLWTLRSRQYEDLDGAAERVLLDDEADSPMAGSVRGDRQGESPMHQAPNPAALAPRDAAVR
jgi:cbb3-type cytochrome oxidase maturation protein